MGIVPPVPANAHMSNDCWLNPKSSCPRVPVLSHAFARAMGEQQGDQGLDDIAQPNPQIDRGTGPIAA